MSTLVCRTQARNLALICGVVGILFTVGCSGNDKELGTQLKYLGATVSNHAGSDGVPSSVILSNMSGKEVDLDEALPLVAELSKVENLTLMGTNVSDDQLVLVGKVSSLKALNLSETGITDAGIAHLSSLSKLTSLYLSGTKVTEACLTDVAKIKTLKSLAVDNTAVSGGYDALQSLAELELLVAGKLTINEEAAQQITEIPKLKRLDIMEAELEGGSLGILQSKIESVSH